jgi:hypothetical protein
MADIVLGDVGGGSRRIVKGDAVDYQPSYRSEAGTANGFVYWK